MGKQNNNFEYYKPQSDRDGLFVPSNSESEDCKDSDSKAMFSLPKRKFIRKKGFRRKQGRLCRDLCSAIIPFLIASFIIGTLVSIGYIILGVNGMQQEIELLKIQLFKVKSDEQSDLLQSKNIQSSVSKKLGSLSRDEREIAELKSKVKKLSLQVKVLNSTILQMKSQKGSLAVSSNVNKDLDLLKKGMADTGGEIKKLSDESEGAKKTIALLSKLVKSLKSEVLQVKEAVSSLDSSAVPTKPVDTLKPFVPTTAPVDKAKENTKSLKRLSNLLKKLVDGYSELFNNKTRKLSLEISHLKADMVQLNSTAKINFISLHNSIAVLQNLTRKQEVSIHSAMGQLDNKSMKGAVNITSDGKVLKIVKGILVGLKDNKKSITNLTERVSSIERQLSIDGTQKREEPVKVDAENSEESTSTSKPQTKPSEKPTLFVKTTSAFTTSSRPASSTANQPMKSTFQIETSESPTTATTDLPTTFDMESTETEASTTSVPSSPEPGNHSTVGTNLTEQSTMTSPSLSPAEPSSSGGENSDALEDVIPSGKPGFNATEPPISNMTNNIDLNANGIPHKTRDHRQQMETSDEPDFNPEAERMGNQGLDFDRMPSDPDLGYNDYPFRDNFGKGKDGIKSGHRTEMERKDFMSNRRSKHESIGDDDGFDALDHLDDEV